MKPAPIPAKHEIDAFVGPCLALIGWLIGVIARLGAPRRSKLLRRIVGRAEHYVQCLIFLWAATRTPPPRPVPRRPLNTPPGFRRGRRSRRMFMRHAGIALRRASFAARMRRLVSALANPERHIARLEKVLRRGLRAPALIPVAPPAHRFISALAAAPLPADSS